MKLFTKANVRLLSLLTSAAMLNLSVASVTSPKMCKFSTNAIGNVGEDTTEMIEFNITTMDDIQPTSSTVVSTTTNTTSTVGTTTTTNVETSTSESTSETTTAESTTTVPETTTEIITEPYIVYKPSTHYIHMSTCRWFNSECIKIDSTEDIECRRCSECHPDIEIVNEYTTTTTTTTTTVPVETEPATEEETVESNSEEETTEDNSEGLTSLKYITDVERIYICNVVAAEYGADYVPIYDKAMIVCGIMNRVNHGGWTRGLPSTVYNVLMAPYQFNPDYVVPYYRRNVTQSCIDAVEYYFEHIDEFPTNIHSWCGDGRYNYFR